MSKHDRELIRLEIGRTVRAEAARRGLRQEDLGCRLGLSQASISSRFAGRIAFTADELSEIALWFDLPIETFFESALPQRAVAS